MSCRFPNCRPFAQACTWHSWKPLCIGPLSLAFLVPKSSRKITFTRERPLVRVGQGPFVQHNIHALSPPEKQRAIHSTRPYRSPTCIPTPPIRFLDLDIQQHTHRPHPKCNHNNDIRPEQKAPPRRPQTRHRHPTPPQPPRPPRAQRPPRPPGPRPGRPCPHGRAPHRAGGGADAAGDRGDAARGRDEG